MPRASCLAVFLRLFAWLPGSPGKEKGAWLGRSGRLLLLVALPGCLPGVDMPGGICRSPRCAQPEAAAGAAQAAQRSGWMLGRGRGRASGTAWGALPGGLFWELGFGRVEGDGHFPFR